MSLSGLVLRTARNWGLSGALVPPRTEPGTPSTHPGPQRDPKEQGGGRISGGNGWQGTVTPGTDP